MSDGALTSFTVCDAYCYFVRHNYLRQKVGHAETI